MGYPVEMIGKDTKLYGIIGSSAIEHQLEAYFNRYFQEMDIDCKAMPLNIREDDLGFFLNGLKDSKIAGVYIEKAYQSLVYDLLKPDDETLRFIQACDAIDIANGAYKSSMVLGEALVSLTKENQRYLVVGNSPEAKSFLYHLVQANPEEIHFASSYIEEMVELMDFVPSNITHDVHRVIDNSVRVEADIMINFTIDKIQAKTGSSIHIKEDFDKIIDKIAEIKTKEWSQHG